MAEPFYTCCEDGMLSQVPPTDRSGLCPACKATAKRVRVSLKRVVDNFVAERAHGIGAASATAHLSQYEDAASTGNEGGWTGCGECDCAFTCYHGRTRCIRLPAPGVAPTDAPRLLELLERCELWARQVSEQSDVRVGIRLAGARLSIDIRRVLKERASGVMGTGCAAGHSTSEFSNLNTQAHGYGVEGRKS